MFKLYECPGDLARHALSVGRWSGTHAGGSWTNNESFDRSAALALYGDKSLVPEAEKMMEKLEHQLETPNIVWERSVAGAFPIVPDFLAGEIACMRTREPQFCDRSPISLLIDLSSSGGDTSERIRRRGIAQLALTMALAQVRPVQLFVYVIGDGRDQGESIIACKINTQPLDLASACYVTTSCGFDRNLGMALMHHLNGFAGHWPHENYKGNRFKNRVAKLCGAGELSMVVGPTDHRDMDVDPVKWINAQLAKFNTPEEE